MKLKRDQYSVDVTESEKISLLFDLATKKSIFWSTDTALVLTAGPCLRVNKITQPDHWVGKNILEYIGTRDITHPLIRMHLNALSAK